MIEPVEDKVSISLWDSDCNTTLSEVSDESCGKETTKLGKRAKSLVWGTVRINSSFTTTSFYRAYSLWFILIDFYISEYSMSHPHICQSWYSEKET